ncbi:F0F1 ATP synthase subunit delta [Lacisediminihabitans changchengi]|uniref:ATP synthase subunit delta n=1 Tax=Lacisediminihabitans changchengi TaxID=2787634 RepID=A0A934SR69_9MICO|nr:F0F1 ATP synthase subunit delta [Lacisediminihabitans changchengi]MBK4347495.1 F0F1 ATP synthase subunit delta [Lacisediminihabitans changchengi]
MGSATREALSAARAELSALGTVTLATAEELFSAGRIIGASSQLLTLLSESNGGTGAQDSADDADKKAAVTAVFGPKFGEQTIRLLHSVVDHRWSSQDDLLAGIEELGLRAAAESAGKDVSIETELFAFATAVTSDPNLELAVGSKLGSSEAKVVLVTRLLEKKVSAQTLTIVRQLVQQPRGRRIGELLRTAATIVADQSGLAVATVTSAAPIATEQLARLQRGLATSYGREVKLNLVIDPTIIGGLRVQLGDDVIDGTVSRKLSDLRLQLAG